MPSPGRASPPLLAAVLVSLFVPLLAAELAASWESVRNWSVQPVCVPIPANMSLCRDIGYSQMRLPNLLQHESLSEVVQQSATWMSLLNLRCHPDTQLFLCSLYAPICLESEIPPCRSLCQNVERGCAGRMAEYGYPWPDIVRCDKFAEDNDMCIKPQSGRKPETAVEEPAKEHCQVCEQPETKESIMDHFCRSDVVFVSKFRRLRPDRAQLGKGRLFKPQSATREQRRALRRPQLAWAHDPNCCPAVQARAGKYLVMARHQGSQLVPTMVMPWKRDRLFRSIRGLMRRFDCSDSRTIQEQILPSTSRRGGKRRSKPGARRRPKRPRRRQGQGARGSGSGGSGAGGGGKGRGERRGRQRGRKGRRGRGRNRAGATTTELPTTPSA